MAQCRRCGYPDNFRFEFNPVSPVMEAICYNCGFKNSFIPKPPRNKKLDDELQQEKACCVIKCDEPEKAVEITEKG